MEGTAPHPVESAMTAFATGPLAPTDAALPDSHTRKFALPFQNTYARLPGQFFARVDPVPVRAPRLIKLNRELARELQLDPAALESGDGVQVLAGNRVALGSEPLAIAYAGHQFGNFVPQLGDGRANLLGELLTRDGRRYDLQLKGSGPTPFSRRGDGRAALGPVLREYLVSEAMFALGVPTTRALAAVVTGETVFRETPQPGAVFARVAASHLRVGTFQYFAARGDVEGLQTLAEHAMARHYPQAAHAAKRIRALLDGVIAAHATLVAQWVLLGFIHGVMNTDNTSISGETLDYGPCAFLEGYEPAKVFSSIDQRGRYAYANQPHAAHWNLTRLAEALLPLLAQEEGESGEDAGVAAAQEALAAFAPRYEAARLAGLRRKLGLRTELPGDAALAEDLLARMAAQHADFTNSFRSLCAAAEGDPSPLLPYGDWTERWKQRIALEPASPSERAASMRAVNPAYIPRNHLVAAVIDAAVDRADFSLFEDLLRVTAQPFSENPALARYAAPAQAHEEVTATFCGT